MLFWGFDLGDGESTIARVSGESAGIPEVVEIGGRTVVITAWAVMKNGEVRIGEHAARSAAAAIRSAARFKSRFLDPDSDSPGLIRDYAARILELLRQQETLVGGERSNTFYIGCPAGWDEAARAQYQKIFENLGVPAPRVISESRAVMVGAVQSNSLRDYVDLRSKSVLVIDIGSSTTDFAYIREGHESEIRTGGEVALGGGIMDQVLLKACIDSSPQALQLQSTLDESESWRVDCELHARALKEAYFSRDDSYWDNHSCSETLLITYDQPLLLELRMDASQALLLTEKACKPLQGRSFHEVFADSLRQIRDNLETPPELLFLTGGVSRMKAISRWCAEIFPEAVIYTDREPEYSVARGLAWCGYIDDELRHFRQEVDTLIASSTVERIVEAHLPSLYQAALDRLLDPILDSAVTPTLLDWRDGRIDTLADMEPILQEKIKQYLYASAAREQLFEPVQTWVQQVARDLEQYTSAICRKYHLPDHSLEITSGLTASDLQLLEKLDSHDLFSRDSLAGPTLFIESIISVLVGLLCGGSGVVLITEGPVGILIGIVSSLLLFTVAHVLGKDAMDDRLRHAHLPLFARKLALSTPQLHMPHPVHRLKKWLESDAEDLFRLLDEPDAKPAAQREPSTGIPERRIRAIRTKVRAAYDKLLSEEGNEDLQALHDRMCRDVSDQIESRLRALSEQVEIPL